MGTNLAIVNYVQIAVCNVPFGFWTKIKRLPDLASQVQNELMRDNCLFAGAEWQERDYKVNAACERSLERVSFLVL